MSGIELPPRSWSEGWIRRRTFDIARIVAAFALALPASAQLGIGPSLLPDGVLGSPYSAQFTVTRGVTPYTFAAASGSSLPPGLQFATSSTLIFVQGTPTAAGTFQFSVVGDDGSSPPITQTVQYTLRIQQPGSPFVFVSSSLPNAMHDYTYAPIYAVAGGTEPYSFTYTGTAPLGVPDSAGRFYSSSVTQAAGTYTFTLTATDSSTPPNTIQGAFSLTVVQGVEVGPTQLSSPTGSMSFGEFWYCQVSGSGGVAPYAYAVAIGSLPPGLTLNGATGLLSGAPSAGGYYAFRITATDANGQVGYRDYTATLSTAVFLFPWSTPPPAYPGVPWLAALTAAEGTPPYVWSTQPGFSMPAGWTLTSQGLLSGVPSTTSNLTFLLRVTDSTGIAENVSYTVTVYFINPASLPAAAMGVAYYQGLGVQAFVPSSITVTSGSLPPGLSLVSQGVQVIQGTPTQPGSYTFTLTAIGPNGEVARQTYTMTIPATTPRIINPYWPQVWAWLGESYSATASAGSSPSFGGQFIYSLTAGTPPPGLTLTADGTLSGVPTATGDFTLTLTAQDGLGNSGSLTFTLHVFAGHLQMTPQALPTATVNQPYTVTLAPSEGTPPYFFSVLYSILPAAFQFRLDNGNNPTEETLTGTPQYPGAYSFRITATDANHNNVTRDYSFTVQGSGLVIQPASLPAFQWDVPFSQQLTVTVGVPPYTFGGGSCLPPGISYSAAGLISGTPTSGPSGSCVFTVQDSASGSGQTVYHVNQVTAAFSVSPAGPSLTDGQAGVAYSAVVSVSGTPAVPVHFTISNGALPPGLSTTTDPSGTLTISGTPTTMGSYGFRVTAIDALGRSVNPASDYSIWIAPAPITITTVSLPNSKVGQQYSVTLSATGGAPPYTWTLGSGSSLPSGLSLASATGVISGVPSSSSAGTYSIQIVASDSSSPAKFGSKSYLVTIAPTTLILTPSSLPSGHTATAYSATIQASGGTPPYTFSLSFGSLPNGLALGSAGVISGVPRQVGYFNFNVTATDANGATGLASYTLSIAGDTITVGPSTLPDATVGRAYSAQLTASGGTAPYTFALTGGLWNANLHFAATGAITGTPATTDIGSFYFYAQATDANGSSGTGLFSLTIDNVPSVLTITPTTLPAMHIGSPYSVRFQAAGGAAPYVFSLTSGVLRPGLVLTPAGVLAGTPMFGSGAGSSIQITARDSTGAIGYKTYTLAITTDTIALGPASLPDAYVGQSYSAQLTASGGKAPYAFSLLSSSMCYLSLGPDGEIVGVPPSSSSACGTLQFSVQATDSGGVSATGLFQIAFHNSLYVPAQYFPSGQIGVAYSIKLAAALGSPPYAWSIASGSLPSGLTLTASGIDAGVVAGTPAAAGGYPFTARVTDSLGATATAPLSITILNLPTITTGSPMPSGTTGTAYSQTFAATGGAPPYTWSVTSGLLPTGLSLNSAGVLSGNPATGGVFSFTLQVTDAAASTGSANLTLSVAPPPVSIFSTSPLPEAALAAPYSVTFIALGGSPPYSWSLASGALPGGLSLSAGGALSGTPIGAGAFNFTVRVQDSASRTATTAFALTVAGPAVITRIAGGAPPPAPVAAVAASIGEPSGIAADSSGNVYFSSLHSVFKIDTTGTLYPVAGNGVPGFSGDGGPAVSASLASPSGLALDGLGNIYIADTGNNRIRKVTPSGNITTFAGSGIAADSGDYGPATTATLNRPTGVAVGASGSVYIADAGASTIRKVTAAGAISTVASYSDSSHTTTFAGVAVDGSESVYYFAQSCACIVKVAAGLNNTSIVAGAGTASPGDGGLATSALLGPVFGFTVTPAGNIYISAGTVRFVNGAGFIGTLTANAPPGYSGDGAQASNAQVNLPSGIAVDASGNIYIADMHNGRIRKIRTDGVIVTIAGVGDGAWSGDTGPAARAQLFRPSATAIDAAGNLYIADTGNNRVRMVTPGGAVTTFAGNGVAGHSGDRGAATSAQINAPAGVAVDGLGNLYVSEAAAVRKVATSGIITTVAGNGSAGYSGDGGSAASAQLNRPSGLAVDSQSNLFIADTYNGRVREVTPGGVISTFAGNGSFAVSGDGGQATSAQIAYPTAVAVDSSGNLYIAAGQVRRVLPSGVISTVATGNYITGVAVDASGNLYAADLGNYRVSAITPSGIVIPVAGTGMQGYSGDGGPASVSQLYSPYGVMLDSGSSVFIVDNIANVVRRVQSLTPVSITAPAALPRAVTGVSYPQTFAATGGLPPYSWSVSSGTLPSGLTLDASGSIAGAPSATGSFIFTIQVTDSASLSAARSYSMAVSSGALAVATTSPLSAGSIGAVYSQSLSASGGTPPDTAWIVASGSLPPGLSLSLSGVLSGTPTATGAYSFTLQVTDTASAVASKAFQLTIDEASYLVGDVYPYNSDIAPNFGDGNLNVLDLIQVLFAVNNLPSFRPTACSDRFDAMDLYPADTGTTRGGDGILDIRDLILELFRVNNLDLARPIRTTRGGVCPTAAVSRLDAVARPARSPRPDDATGQSGRRGRYPGLRKPRAGRRRSRAYASVSRREARVHSTGADLRHRRLDIASELRSRRHGPAIDHLRRPARSRCAGMARRNQSAKRRPRASRLRVRTGRMVGGPQVVRRFGCRPGRQRRRSRGTAGYLRRQAELKLESPEARRADARGALLTLFLRHYACYHSLSLCALPFPAA